MLIILTAVVVNTVQIHNRKISFYNSGCSCSSCFTQYTSFQIHDLNILKRNCYFMYRNGCLLSNQSTYSCAACFSANFAAFAAAFAASSAIFCLSNGLSTSHMSNTEAGSFSSI